MGTSRQESIYQKVYDRDEDDNGNSLITYGTVNHGGAMQAFMKSLKPLSVADIGCGYGHFCLYMDSVGVQTIGIDFAAPMPKEDDNNVRWIKADATDLPLEDGEVEWATAFDVLEHIPRRNLDQVIKELLRVSQRGFVASVCFRDSVYRMDGQSLHLIVKPCSWWTKKLSTFGKVSIFEEFETYGHFIVHKEDK